MTRSDGRNYIDYLLVMIATACATFSGGMAVASNEVAFGSVIAVILGTLVSAAIAHYGKGNRILRIDALLYLVIAFTAYAGRNTLNLLLPVDTFTPELMPSSWLLWMMVLGAPFLWRDSTLLFQAIPALALFGFVGCYDTFREVVFFFFIYLICAATLFSRTHAREMASMAEQSGYFGGDLNSLRANRKVVDRLRRGPWRWMAGPDWALGSAAIIVLLSLLGAPVLRQTVKPISGVARLRAPQQVRRTQPQSGLPQNSQETTRIAQGPVKLRNTPVYEVSETADYYFRTDAYDTYRNGTWVKDWRWRAADGSALPLPEKAERITYLSKELGRVSRRNPAPFREETPALERLVARPLTIRARVPVNSIPVPGDFIAMSSPISYSENVGDTVTLQRPSQFEVTIQYGPRGRGNADVRIPKNRDGRRDPALSASGTSPDFERWALEQAGNGSPWQRAERLRAAIASTIRYNINASQAPIDSDPVARAIFDTKEGYCDVFASAMVLGSRAIGIPARYSVGYLGDTENDLRNGPLVLLESDRHAWAELDFGDQGWVVYDATAGAEVVPGGGRRDGSPDAPWYTQIEFRRILDFGVPALVVVAGVFLFWPKRRDGTAALHARDAAVDDFVNLLGRATRHERRLDETLREYVQSLLPYLGSESGAVLEMSDELERTLYAPGELTVTEAEALRKRVKVLAPAVRSAAKAAAAQMKASPSDAATQRV